MTHADAFSPDYTAARTRFVRAAMERGAALSSHPLTATAPSGDALSIDVAALGPMAASTVVIVSSGLHGVEGFFGSAVQLAWLARGVDVPADVRVILVHALNPFGFAWRRRTNEHNVDLNRNFLTDRTAIRSQAHLESQAIYDRLSPFLNPPSPPPHFEAYTAKAAVWATRVGLKRLQRALPIGQYVQPRGLFFGGTGAEPSAVVVRNAIGEWMRGARLAVHLDLHSGLGTWGQEQWLIDDVAGSPRAEWATRHFGPNVRASDDRVVYRAQGTMTSDLRSRLLECEYLGITAEFGTYSGMRVLGALRAENRANFYATPESAAYERAKRQLVETFAPASVAWRETAVTGALALIERATTARLI